MIEKKARGPLLQLINQALNYCMTKKAQPNNAACEHNNSESKIPIGRYAISFQNQCKDSS